MAHFDNIAQLRQHVADGWISEQKHPYLDLFIYNYTHEAQYANKWDATILQARGLILNREGEIIARPLKKFFNLEEYGTDRLIGHIQRGVLQPIPFDLPYSVTDKMDGSLGILYTDAVLGPALATRGSFTSDQALRGGVMLRRLLNATDWWRPNPQFTYLFEIIYPENRIVVDYGTAEKLVLLAVVNTDTGDEVPLEATHYPFPVVESFPDTTIEWLTTQDRPNREGYVVRFADGTRIKVKHAEYVRLHRILTQVSTRTIWEMLRDGGDISSMIEAVPDEFYEFVHATIDELTAAYRMIETNARHSATTLQKYTNNRAELAERVKQTQYPALVFKMLDGKTYDHIIWKMLRPAYAKPFARDADA